MRIAAAGNPFVPGAPRIVPERCLDGSCTKLADAEEVFVNISQLVLGGIGIVLLGTFVYGGLLYLSSQGEPGKVKKAHEVLKGSLFGLMIVFGSYAAVTYVVQGLAGDVPGVTDEQVQTSPAPSPTP